MLVVNNGVPKSGSTLVQKVLLMTEQFAPDIGKFQNPLWRNISVEKEIIPEFLDGYEYHNINTCIKMHIDPEVFARRNDPHIKLLTSYRNLKDSIVSRGHHLKRLKNQGKENHSYSLEEYFSNPKYYANTARKFGLHYLKSKQSNSFMIKYEDLISNKKESILRGIYSYIGIDVSEQRIQKIIDSTDPGIKNRSDLAENKHIRTGGISVSRIELPEYTYSQLDKLDNLLFKPGTSIDEWKINCRLLVDRT